jgi:hypothetical protein
MFFSLETNPLCRFEDGSLDDFDLMAFSVPNTPKDGFRLRIHDPYEVASKTTQTFITTLHRRVLIDAIPNVLRIDGSLANEDVEM